MTESKTVLITGGTRGIGRAIVEKFIENNYKVVCVYKNSHDIADDMRKKHPNLQTFACDIANYDEVIRLKEQVGSIDILVNNAGISSYNLFTDETPESFETIFNANVKGMFNITNIFAKDMILKQSGNIINISSMWGEVGASCEVLYSATKGAIISMTKALAKELAPSKIRVNSVSPGVIKTDMLNEFTEDELDFLINQTPLERIGEGRDVADAVFFLASDNSSFITGQILGVNGGYII